MTHHPNETLATVQEYSSERDSHPRPAGTLSPVRDYL